MNTAYCTVTSLCIVLFVSLLRVTSTALSDTTHSSCYSSLWMAQDLFCNTGSFLKVTEKSLTLPVILPPTVNLPLPVSSVYFFSSFHSFLLHPTSSNPLLLPRPGLNWLIRTIIQNSLSYSQSFWPFSNPLERLSCFVLKQVLNKGWW